MDEEGASAVPVVGAQAAHTLKEATGLTRLELQEVCPKKHALKAFATPHARFNCDLCGADQPSGAAMRGCRRCEYDICAVCKAEEATALQDVDEPDFCFSPVEVLERSDDIRKPTCDERAYRYIKLSNQLQVLLVSDPEADKAAASMDVAVGHACDPPELPGLAHFLEQ